MPGRTLSDSCRAVIYALHEENLSNRAIAARVGCDRRTFDRLLARHSMEEPLTPRIKSGVPRKTTQRDDSTMSRMVLRDRRITAGAIQAEMQHRGVNVSAHTVRRRLLIAGFLTRRPIRKPFLSKKMKKSRLEWARSHQNWTVDDWKKVLWSDESRFNLSCLELPPYGSSTDWRIFASRLHREDNQTPVVRNDLVLLFLVRGRTIFRLRKHSKSRSVPRHPKNASNSINAGLFDEKWSPT